MYSIQLIGTGAVVSLLPASVQPGSIHAFQQITFQVTSGAGTARIGDAGTTSTKGIALTSTSAPLQIQSSGVQYSGDLDQFRVYLPNALVMDILVLE